MTTVTEATTAHPATVHRPTPAPGPSLPPAGPAWYPAAMGTGILSTLLQLHSGRSAVLHPLAVGVLAIGWVVLVGLSAAYARRIAADRAALTSTLTDTATLPLWGTVSMGLLAVGAATLAVLPSVAPAAAGPAVILDAVLWAVGTALGLATAFGFAAVLLRRRAGLPSPVWGLPIVPPMVSATTGAALVPHVGSAAGRFALLLATLGCFFVALTLGLLVFALAYHHHWRISPIPVAASASAWIPLGIVGQSTAAAQAIVAHGTEFLSPSGAQAAQTSASVYGTAMLALGAPLVAFAVVVTARGFRAGMPFTPGWWALTFPVGTISLGALLLGNATGSSVATAVSWVALGVLVGTWSLCTTASVRAVARVAARVATPAT